MLLNFPFLLEWAMKANVGLCHLRFLGLTVIQQTTRYLVLGFVVVFFFLVTYLEAVVMLQFLNKTWKYFCFT